MIVIGALVRTGRRAQRTLRLATDFAVGAESRTNPSAAGIRVSKDTDLDIETLESLMRLALRTPAPGAGSEEQALGRAGFDKLARRAAADLLENAGADDDGNRGRTPTRH